MDTCAWCGQPAAVRLIVASYVGQDIRRTETLWCATDVRKATGGLMTRRASGETVAWHAEPIT